MHIINLDASINQWAWNQSVVLSSIPTSYFTLYTYCDISKFRSVSLLCILKFLVFGKIPSFWQTLVGIKSKCLGNNTRNLCQLLAYTQTQEFIPVVLGDKNLPFNVSPSILRTYFAKRGLISEPFLQTWKISVVNKRKKTN